MVSSTYPTHREADVVLRDGSTVHIRPVRPEDEPGLHTFFQSLSEDARTLRFFTPAVNLAAEAHRESHVDYRRTYALVATAGHEPAIVGHALYAAGPGERAEVAFAIGETLRGQGLGTLLLGQLAEAAAANGIRVFEAIMLPSNHRMLDMFRQSGFRVEVHARPDELHVAFPSSLTPEALEQFDRREQLAGASALQRVLCPRSVAVIGASRRRGTVGGEVFHNLLAYELNGPVYPVNPSAPVVQSVAAYASVADLPGPADLAVIAVPGTQVIEAAEACGRAGVRALVVLSAGFGEVGEAGRVRQAELLRVCRAYGMRLVGPNCLGVVNTDPAVRLDATFGPHLPTAGRVGFASQSGALGLAAVDYAAALGLGIASFVSLGNKADLSGNDLLNYWESDPRTDLILLYLESFGNPRKFGRIARRVGRAKPIVVVKSGRSAAGARASSSHTGALLAASDVTVDALFRQAGVIRAETMEELFAVAALLAHQPLPTSNGVAIVTNVGGPGILCADACEAHGLRVPLLAESTRARLRAFLPPEASVANPVDMIASATAEHYRLAVGAVEADPAVDAVIAVFLPPLATEADAVAQALVQAAADLARRKPLLAVFMSGQGAPPALETASGRIPTYAFPESAALALAHAARYSAWRAQPSEPAPGLDDVRRDEAAAIVATALGRGGGWLAPDEVAQLLGSYGLPLVEQRLGRTPAEAARLAGELGGTVALKAVAPGLVHKTELGAVRLDLQGPRAVSRAAREMAASLRAAGQAPTGFVVQRMVAGGVEMLLGVVQDPQFGPVVACGAGGVLVELVKDVAVRLAPLTARDAAEMLHELKTYPLLEGFRGAPACDVPALVEAILRVSALADDLPAVAELDCNPLLVLPQGVAIVDARVRIAPTEPPLPLGARPR